MSEQKIQLCVDTLAADVADMLAQESHITISAALQEFIRFIEDGYEPFHLTGTQGVIDEVDDYIRIQREHLEVRCS